MQSSENGTSADYVSEASLFYQRLEEEKVNLLGRYRPPGSGQEWYGDELAVLDELNYTSRFDFTDLIQLILFNLRQDSLLEIKLLPGSMLILMLMNSAVTSQA
jgi:hypothetical protein